MHHIRFSAQSEFEKPNGKPLPEDGSERIVLVVFEVKSLYCDELVSNCNFMLFYIVLFILFCLIILIFIALFKK